jgi:hypothetical protein
VFCNNAELYRKVRLAGADGMSARAAARHFNISRATVEKALAFSVPPGYRRTVPIKRPKLDGFAAFIDAWLVADISGLLDGEYCSRKTGTEPGQVHLAPPDLADLSDLHDR